jgi:hypothetical protein
MKQTKVIYIFLIVFLLLIAGGVYLLNPFQSKVKSGLQVIINNSKASLFLDGQYLDKTPYINKKIKPGEYILRIEPDNPELETYQTPITLTKGVLTVVTWSPGPSLETSGGVIYELEPLNSNKETEVAFVSVPDGAIINFDQQETQFAPLVIKDLDAGHHEFKASLPSYQPQKHSINVLPGYRLNINIKLAKDKIELGTGAQAGQEATTDSQSQSQSEKAASDNTESAQTDEDEDEAKNATEPAAAQPEPTATPQPESSLGALEASQGQVTISDTGYIQQDTEVLRVRQEPNTSSQQVGFVEAGKSYPYLGAEERGWYKISFTDALDQESQDKKQGWVSGQYAQLD